MQRPKIGSNPDVGTHLPKGESNGTRMTRIQRINADKTKKISENPPYPRHPRSI
jgi:hypothetical protein